MKKVSGLPLNWLQGDKKAWGGKGGGGAGCRGGGCIWFGGWGRRWGCWFVTIRKKGDPTGKRMEMERIIDKGKNPKRNAAL